MAMEKLVIKIKIPPGGSELRFQCPTCKKCFSTGKGLGGHKRIHNAAKNRGRQNRSSSELQIVSYAAAGGNQSQGSSSELQVVAQPENNAVQNLHVCPVCDQAWASLKSVHGHMRKHRERTWRGMIPPASEAAVGYGAPLLLEGSSSAGESDRLALVVASDVEMPRWAGRRRRHGKAPVEMIQEADDDSICGAYDLMALAVRESSRRKGFGPKKKKQKLEVGNPGPVVIPGGNSGNTSLFIRKRKMFVCDICNKQFRTYQALGGHKSHHLINVGGGDESAAADQSPTGEALGDERQQPPPPAAEVGSCPGGEKEKENQPRVYGFDLNELPPPEEME